MSEERRAMATRRTFLQYGAAVAAAAASPLIANAVPQNRGQTPGQTPGLTPGVPLVVVDRTAVGSAAFAAAFARRGARVLSIGPDVARAWMDDIEPTWRGARTPLAGLTRAGALFCLELLARSHDRGTVHRAVHTLLEDHRWSHALAHSSDAAAIRELERAGVAWSAVAAELAAHAPQTRPLEIVDATADSARTEPLYSWVIAPRRRAHGHKG